MAVKTSPIPDYGTTFEIERWIEMCECGGFIDYDGYGQYCMKNVVIDGDEGYVIPSHVKKGKVKKFYTHIHWYNR
jgi:hypothetical protein